MSWRHYLYAETPPPPLSFWGKLIQSFFHRKKTRSFRPSLPALRSRRSHARKGHGVIAMALTALLSYAMSYAETLRQHARPVGVALGLGLVLMCIVSVSELRVIRSSLFNEDAVIQIEMRDDGHGIPADRLADMFEPTFAVKDGRVVTSNWRLSSSRRIIAEHHGHLELESIAGQGTLARIHLPISRK